MACVMRSPSPSRERAMRARSAALMTRRLTGARGLSLVEVTIMLLVLMTLTGVLAPSIMDFVRDAQWVKAKEDCEAIGVSVVRLMRDVGPCFKFDGTGACTKANRADLLYSDGPDVRPEDTGGEAAMSFDGGGNTAGPLNWHTDSARGDSMQHQFVDNGGGPGLSRAGGNRSPGLRRPRHGFRLAGRLSLAACRPRSLGTPLPGEQRVPLGRPRRGIGHRRGAAKRRLVARYVLHLGGPQRPVRDAVRRQCRPRCLSARRRPHLRGLRGHALMGQDHARSRASLTQGRWAATLCVGAGATEPQ